MDHDPQRTETAFNKACSYLNFNKSAKWFAHAAAVGNGLVIIALLGVLWLFVDLMVWRGRIPDYDSLSEQHKRVLGRKWADADARGREAWANDAWLPPAEARQVAARPLGDLTPRQKEALWQQFVWDTLAGRVGRDAAERAFPTVPTPAGDAVVFESNNHGALSLAVREEASGRWWSPVFWVASWNRWMWSGPSATSLLPPYLLGLFLLALALLFAWASLVILNREMAARATIEATTRLRRAVYHHTFRLGTLAIRAMGPSEAVSILTRHIEAVHDALFLRLTVGFRDPIFILLLLLFAFAVNPLLALAFLLFAIVVWAIGSRVLSYFLNRSRVATHVAAERLTIIRESLMLMRLVKSYLMEQFNQARIERQLARYSRAQRVRARGDSLAVPMVLLLVGVCALVLLFVAGLFVLYGQLSVAGAVALVTALLCLYRPVDRLLQARKQLRRGREAAEQVFNFLEARGGVGQVVGAEFLPPLNKQLELDKVTLRDPSTGRTLLEDVSLSIAAGQRVALVGPDDLEKHALVYLLPRLLDPSSGEIRIDQHNLRLVTLDSLRTQISVVTLPNLVFHDTVRNNIGCGDPGYTLPQIIEAAKIAHAHHFIQKLPQGYETPIGELGHALSLSQQYRIALARAVLRDPALVVVEEPDAELDDETKDLLDDTMARVLPGRTSIILPHRISTLRSCDVIFLLHKGRIVASGTHKDLLATNKLYRHLHYLEFNEMDEQA